ncbi:MAG TPA: WD40 repeat domain-containing protein, partial [Gemmataceae bacterium]|nr:WD40 repeat domain-containing protein [Gemmataceae bacterium]
MSRMPTTVRIGAFFAVVGALAVALYVTLPTEPTSVVSGTDMVADLLSSDGTYFTGGFYTSEIGGHQCASLKVWDARTGAERGDYFRKLIAALYVVHDGVPIGQVGDPDQRGFTLADIRYSHDRRYCVLLHRRGLALADLQEGREWQTAVPLDIVLDPDPGVNKIVRQLDRRIDEHLLQHAAEKKTKWKEALSLWKAIARCQFPVVVDRKAIAAAAKRDEDPDEVEVKFPVWTARSSAGNVLEDLISQLSGGTADYFVRSDHIEITTKKEKHKSRILLPTFSPLGTFIVLPMIAADKGKLHVVECATGTLIATLPMHLNVQWQNIHFTPDDELLCFPAADRSALIVWDTKSRQTLRTIDGIGIGHDPLAPDGVTMLLNGGAEIVNLRTGVRRPFIEGQVLDKLFHSFVFSPDSKA